MVDYIKNVGPYGDSYMMIRDLGQTVEFWLQANTSLTYHQKLPWGWTVNGSTGSGTTPYNYPWPGGSVNTRGPWHRVASYTVLYSQNVTFRLGKTGLIGFQGPHTFTKYIERATVRVRVSGVWRTGVPYVRSGGKWKIGQAWVRDGSVWKRGS